MLSTAEDDKSLAIMFLSPPTSLAYLIDLNPEADKASSTVKPFCYNKFEMF